MDFKTNQGKIRSQNELKKSCTNHFCTIRHPLKMLMKLTLNQFYVTRKIINRLLRMRSFSSILQHFPFSFALTNPFLLSLSLFLSLSFSLCVCSNVVLETHCPETLAQFHQRSMHSFYARRS